MAKVYAYMGVGLLLTAVVALFTVSNTALLTTLKTSWLIWPAMLIPFVMAMVMSFGYEKLSAMTLRTLFFLYAALNGFSFGVIVSAYTTASVVGAFFSTAALFGVMSVYGYFTKKDLSSWGQMLFVGLIGIIIAMVINMFLQSSVMDTVISCVAVLVFLGLTAYDTQTIRDTLWAEREFGKAGVMGALNLYLDFVNLFLHLLRLIGVKVPSTAD